MKRSKLLSTLFLSGFFFILLPLAAQKKSLNKDTVSVTNGSSPAPASPKSGPKPFKEVISDRAITDQGLLTVHKLEDKWYWEITDSILGRDILVVSRLSKSGAGLSNGFTGYAGDIINNNVIRFETGPNHKIFLKRISY
ncbi:MAG: DUF5118 domain-containing protein, partial [Bacteroidota bacterium]